MKTFGCFFKVHKWRCFFRNTRFWSKQTTSFTTSQTSQIPPRHTPHLAQSTLEDRTTNTNTRLDLRPLTFYKTRRYICLLWPSKLYNDGVGGWRWKRVSRGPYSMQKGFRDVVKYYRSHGNNTMSLLSFYRKSLTTRFFVKTAASKSSFAIDSLTEPKF